MTQSYSVWTGDSWREVPVPVMDGEPLVVPNVAAVVYDEDRSHLLLQRRDKPDEAVRGRLEVPGGRWGAGESAAIALAREVLEETGVTVTEMISAGERYDFGPDMAIEATHPAVVVTGLSGSYPALMVVYECIGVGSPRPLPNETSDPTWWRVDDVRSHLAEDPDDFVWHAAAVLRAVLGVS